MRPDLVVLRALGLGDLLTSVPTLRALARAVPGRRVLLAPAALGPLIAEPLGYDVVDVHGVDAVPEALPAEAAGAALAVNLHGRGPQSTRVLRALRPKRLIAFTDATWRGDEHEVARWCRLLEMSGIPADPGDLALDAPGCDPPRAAVGATLVQPGAASGARRWPVERWAAVVAAEVGAGRRVAITGGPDEVGLARSVAAASGLRDEAVLAGRTTVLELASAVAAAGRVVCGDTGVAHLATALGTPSVVLFGPTDPALWGPPVRPAHRVLWAGRTGDPHASEPDAGLLEIGPAEVVEALGALPAGGPVEYLPGAAHSG